MKTRPSSYFLMVIMAFMIFAAVQSVMFRYFEAKVLPLFISLFVLVLAALELKAELKARGKGPELVREDGPHHEKKPNIQIRRFCSAMAWILGFSIGSYLLGFLIAIPLFTLSYLKAHGRGWLTSLGFAAIVAGFIYLTFELGLKAQLHPGMFFEGIGNQ